MGTAMPQMEQLKKNMKAAWMAGDFGQIAKYNEEEGVQFIKRLEYVEVRMCWMWRAERGIRLFRRRAKARM